MQPDQILATLDGDTRSYLQLLLQGAGDGLGGRGKRLSAGLRQFEPLTRDLAEIGKALAVRRENIKRSITAFKLVSQELGRQRHPAHGVRGLLGLRARRLRRPAAGDP